MMDQEYRTNPLQIENIRPASEWQFTGKPTTFPRREEIPLELFVLFQPNPGYANPHQMFDPNRKSIFRHVPSGLQPSASYLVGAQTAFSRMRQGCWVRMLGSHYHKRS